MALIRIPLLLASRAAEVLIPKRLSLLQPGLYLLRRLHLEVEPPRPYEGG